MAAKSKIMYDKTEIIVQALMGNRQALLNLTYDKIVNIQFDHGFVKKLFRKIPSERISISVRGMEQPVVLYEANEKEFWGEYKTNLTKFAKDNRISFRDNL